MARYALISDLHGNLENLQAIMESASGRADKIFVTGDYLDAKVSKKNIGQRAEWPLEDVVDDNPALWEVLISACRLIRGNQEERIATALGGQDVPPLLAQLLGTAAEWATPTTRFVHGHRFTWFREGDELMHPVLAEPTDRPVVVHGHSHRRLLTFGLGDPGEPPRLRFEPETGRTYQLPQGERSLINLGAARDAAAHWALYDEEAGTVSFETAAAAIAVRTKESQ
ncbi:metallophosphoesterase family protein [Streptomyces odontomachi]|uniref:metallophosphoesterase family protein n=1 Tax=Streptomyces odontomachi TaxID=2944940 RepID=UPI00210AFC01|nr:metallophosphoesterase [Streptomyces sp. ODS25]